MKTLLLMRHAKSSWKHPELSDMDRPLNKRGKKDAPMMGEFLHRKELEPQHILCSSAVRSRMTAEAILENCSLNCEVEYLDSLYLAEPPAYLDALRALPDSIERAMVIGHNPGLEMLLQILTGRYEAFPSAAIAYLVFPLEHWRELGENSQGELIELWLPEELRDKVKAKEEKKGKKKKRK